MMSAALLSAALLSGCASVPMADATADAQAKDGMFYGQIVEFSPKINRPFLYPALDAHKESLKASIIEAIRAACRRHGT